jgi:hypothetical protein
LVNGRAVAMRSLALALVSTALAVTTATAADESCKEQVRGESKFTPEMVKNFMTKCKDLATMVCSDRAIDQKVSDEAKDTFIKNCVKDEVGK